MKKTVHCPYGHTCKYIWGTEAVDRSRAAYKGLAKKRAREIVRLKKELARRERHIRKLYEEAV